MARILRGQRIATGVLPDIRVTLSRPDGLEAAAPARDVRALVDTGASHTMVRADIVAALNIPLTSSVYPVSGANACGTVGTAVVAVGLMGNSGPEQANMIIDPLEVTVSPTLTGEAILGWDVLKHFDLHFARSGAFSLRWD